ncbi:MAG: NAD(P)H-dependent glycerol-3-phosphate dehydrogenase [Rhodovibrionaceae bacterium]
MISRVSILGAGAWGTALALAARRAGRKVTLWARNPDLAETIAAKHRNPAYLPGIELDKTIAATHELNRAVAEAEALLLVCPAQHLRALCSRLAGLPESAAPLVICAKGIEQRSGLLPSAVVAETLPGRELAVLSGPSFASEVARSLPTAITLACADAKTGAALVKALGSKAFRPYLAGDLIGAQVGGAVKNVIAIACGIAMGLRLGDNARAALITRGLAEISRLNAALGGKPETMQGLSGLGDLMLTCSSMTSRNYSLGYALGEDMSLSDILGSRKSVSEGIYTASAVVQLAARHGIEMPIAEAVDRVLRDQSAIEEAIEALLARPFKAEGD